MRGRAVHEKGRGGGGEGKEGRARNSGARAWRGPRTDRGGEVRGRVVHERGRREWERWGCATASVTEQAAPEWARQIGERVVQGEGVGRRQKLGLTEKYMADVEGRKWTRRKLWRRKERP